MLWVLCVDVRVFFWWGCGAICLVKIGVVVDVVVALWGVSMGRAPPCGGNAHLASETDNAVQRAWLVGPQVNLQDSMQGISQGRVRVLQHHI